MSEIKPQPGVLDVAPYVGGRSSVAGRDRVIKLSSNESALGPSPRAVAALKKAVGGSHRYPDGGAADLREALAHHHGLELERIVCGNGSDEIIQLLCQAYAGPGDEVLHSRHGFVMYPIAARAAGATPVSAPETQVTANVDALLDKVGDKTRLVFLANPNNPTGTYLPTAEVARLQAALPENALLVLDAAYAEFVGRNDYESGAELARGVDNVVMTRTFSKIYGLAGLRLGWAYCPAHVADVLNRVRGPFNVNLPAQAAGVAALGDLEFAGRARAFNDQWRPWLADQLTALGLEPLGSEGNFILVRFPGDAGRTAAAADAFLYDRGIILRNVDGYGFPDCLRVSVGQEDENRELITALNQFMSAA